MCRIGKYTITVTKDKAPVRLEKKVSEKEKLEQLLIRNCNLLNIIIIILIIILFLVVCMIVVPPTNGYFWY